MTSDTSTETSPLVLIERNPPLVTISLNRSACRNAVDRPTAAALAQAFRDFDADDALSVAILSGVGEHFCAGADLKAVSSGDPTRMHRMEPDGDGPMGPSRMQLSKPVIAAISGYCVAGGLELALWCDLRVADDSAVFGVFCRRFGVPLIDGGTVRLPRLIGMSRAMDLILTGRPVDAQEAFQIGLANRLVDKQTENVEDAAKTLALAIAGFPQQCLVNDRQSAYQQWALDESDAIQNEFKLGLKTLSSGETVSGALRFKEGEGRHGHFNDEE